MPVPAPNLCPKFNTIRLSHVCLNVSDLAASRTFYTEILGLQVTDEDDRCIYLRAMEEPPGSHFSAGFGSFGSVETTFPVKAACPHLQPRPNTRSPGTSCRPDADPVFESRVAEIGTIAGFDVLWAKGGGFRKDGRRPRSGPQPSSGMPALVTAMH